MTQLLGQGQIMAIYKDGEQVDEVIEGDEALNRTESNTFLCRKRWSNRRYRYLQKRY